MRFVIPIYGGKVIRARSRPEMARLLKRMKLEPIDDSGSVGSCVPVDGSDGRAVYLIGWYDRNAGTLVHECVHLALLVLQRAGINPTESSGEALAYLTDHLFTRLKAR